jgi:Asp-tRNA(Asn)/Glu-tRNA(Gln) amidotransferase A subunit family amidase
VVGHKPTLGLVPYEQAGDLFSNYAYAGPLTRTVADAAAVTAAIAGAADTDPWTMHPAALKLRAALVGDRLDGLRIGYLRLIANSALDTDVEAATDAMLQRLTERGAIVTPAEPIDWAEQTGRAVYMGNMAANFGRYEAEWGDRMDPVLRDYIAEGRGVTLDQYRQAQFARTRLFRAVQGLFRAHDFLVSPTLPIGALPADFVPGKDTVAINGRPVGTTRVGWAAYVYPFNLTGHPALTIPSGWTRDRLPTGLQIIGPWWSDMDLFRIGGILETAAPWRDRRPPEA